MYLGKEKHFCLRNTQCPWYWKINQCKIITRALLDLRVFFGNTYLYYTMFRRLKDRIFTLTSPRMDSHHWYEQRPQIFFLETGLVQYIKLIYFIKESLITPVKFVKHKLCPSMHIYTWSISWPTLVKIHAMVWNGQKLTLSCHVIVGHTWCKTKCVCRTLCPQQLQSLSRDHSQGYTDIDLGVIWKSHIDKYASKICLWWFKG